jgi:hypothetical protein
MFQGKTAQTCTINYYTTSDNKNYKIGSREVTLYPKYIENNHTYDNIEPNSVYKLYFGLNEFISTTRVDYITISGNILPPNVNVCCDAKCKMYASSGDSSVYGTGYMKLNNINPKEGDIADKMISMQFDADGFKISQDN